MKKLWKKCSLILLGAIFFISATNSCQKKQTMKANQEEKDKKTLSYSVLTPIDRLDPQKLNQLDASTVGYHIYEGLVRNEEGNVIPAGAKSWTVSEDGLTYTFTLRKTCWKDGTAVNAEDYVRGIRRLAGEETNSDYGFLVYCMKNGAAVQQGALKPEKLGVKALDREHLEITLEKKTDYFLSIVSMVQFSPVPKEAEDTKNWGVKADLVMENGPFCIEEWTENKLLLKKNPNYWNASEIMLDQVVITKRDSIKEAKEAYEQGEDQMFSSFFSSENSGDAGSFYQDGQLRMVRLNLKQKKLKNPDFRKALYYAVDQKKLNEIIFEGIQSPTAGFLPSSFGIEEKQTSFQSELAKKYMKKAQKKLKEKKTWKLTLVCREQEQAQRTAAFLKKEWEKTLGISVKIKTVTDEEKLELEAAGDFDMILTKWVPDYSDPLAYLENWQSDSPYNQGGFSCEAFDKKLKKAETKEGEERKQLLLEAEKILEEQVPAVPLYYRRKVLLTKNEVTGIRTYYIGYQYNYIHCDVEQ